MSLLIELLQKRISDDVTGLDESEVQVQMAYLSHSLRMFLLILYRLIHGVPYSSSTGVG